MPAIAECGGHALKSPACNGDRSVFLLRKG